jgi:hypothetical protein
MDRGEGNEASQGCCVVVEILSETPVSSEPGKGALEQPCEGSMKSSLMLRQIDQAGGDLYGISEDLAVVQAELALLPTRGSPEEMARLTLPTS